jgi:hypothetical protein
MVDATNTISYAFRAVYPNSYTAISSASGVLATGSFTPGDIFSLYADGTSIYYQINGVVVATEILNTTPTYRSVSASSFALQYYVLTNVRYYPTGKCCSGGGGAYTPAFPEEWVSPPPTTMVEAMNRVARSIFQLGGPIPVLPIAGFKLQVSGQVDVDYTRYNAGGRTFFRLITSGVQFFINVLADVNIDFLVIGGGGGGGGAYSGGGGAGGQQQGSVFLPSGSGATAMLGNGGAGGSGSTTEYYRGDNGQNTSFLSYVAYGGGGGSGYEASNPAGRDGGCGGGGGFAYGQGGNGLQGYNGGSSSGTNGWTAGGGGLGGNGENDNQNPSGFANGGMGITYYGIDLGGGGAGGGFNYPGGVGTYGGGSGGQNGVPNTGGGGGGSVQFNGPGSGGSGVLILSYIT